MNEFVPRIETVPVERSVPAVRPVMAVESVQSGNGASQNGLGADTGEQARREHMASASDYARVQARIADILAHMDASAAEPEAALSNAETRLAMLRPDPTIVIPMPPASKEVIERAVDLARAMAQQAAITRSAQANVAQGTVDQLLAMPG
tara:strand:- start:60161 stop:60610 length:450 start_codon:yes stop_codon:yes gene_type:complete